MKRTVCFLRIGSPTASAAMLQPFGLPYDADGAWFIRQHTNRPIQNGIETAITTAE